MGNKTIVTIGRQYGSGGRDVGKRLSELLEVPFYDRAELTAIAKHTPDYDEVRSFYEETPADTLLTALALEDDPHTDRLPFKRIRALVGEGGCVLIGRCGSSIFADAPNAARLFLHARPTYRVERIMALEGCSERRAQERMAQTDRARAAFHQYYTGGPWGLAADYDLTVDSGALGVEGTAEFLLDYLKRRHLG